MRKWSDVDLKQKLAMMKKRSIDGKKRHGKCSVLYTAERCHSITLSDRQWRRAS
jgi:hypothetical protein